MKAFASFILRGRFQAIAVVTFAAALSLLLPPFSHISGAAAALVALRNGIREAALIVIGAGSILGAIGFFLSPAPVLASLLVVVTVLAVWVPVLAGAGTLRASRSMGAVLTVLGGLGAAALVVVYAAQPDIAAWWRTMLDVVLRPALLATHTPLTPEEIDAHLRGMARVMTGFMAAGVLYTAMINVLIARWWQAILFNPGGFRQEFLALRLRRGAAAAAAVVVGLSVLLSGGVEGFALNLSIFAVAVFSVQGLALVHAVAAATGIHKGWLIALYVAMVFSLATVMSALAGLGFADSWVDFRARIRRREA